MFKTTQKTQKITLKITIFWGVWNLKLKKKSNVQLWIYFFDSRDHIGLSVGK